MTKKELAALIEKTERTLPYFAKSLESDIIRFKWKSNTEGFKLPFQPEEIVTTKGSLGWDKIHKVWVTGEWEEIRDELGDYTIYVCHTLNNMNIKEYRLKNNEEVIVCGNTPLYRSFNRERAFYAKYKSEADYSLYCQIMNSRLTKAFVADSDKKAEEIKKKFEAIYDGKPVVLSTSLLEDLRDVSLTDNQDVERLQYLTSFYQSLEKREANDAGVDLDSLDKRAQVSTEEIKQYSDVTTMEFLTMWEMRLSFVEEMKENGINIEIVRNPVYFDEPTKEDIEEGSFESAEAEELTEENNEGGNEDGGADTEKSV